MPTESVRVVFVVRFIDGFHVALGHCFCQAVVHLAYDFLITRKLLNRDWNWATTTAVYVVRKASRSGSHLPLSLTLLVIGIIARRILMVEYVHTRWTLGCTRSGPIGRLSALRRFLRDSGTDFSLRRRFVRRGINSLRSHINELAVLTTESPVQVRDTRFPTT